MIGREKAERIAAEVQGQPATDGAAGWELVEFESGWLIRETSDQGVRGGASRVVERESGRVMRFPSSVPPGRILEEYDQVVDRGRVEKEAEESR